jgi:hypothetical protein
MRAVGTGLRRFRRRQFLRQAGEGLRMLAVDLDIDAGISFVRRCGGNNVKAAERKQTKNR